MVLFIPWLIPFLIKHVVFMMDLVVVSSLCNPSIIWLPMKVVSSPWWIHNMIKAMVFGLD